MPFTSFFFSAFKLASCERKIRVNQNSYAKVISVLVNTVRILFVIVLEPSDNRSSSYADCSCCTILLFFVPAVTFINRRQSVGRTYFFYRGRHAAGGALAEYVDSKSVVRDARRAEDANKLDR